MASTDSSVLSIIAAFTNGLDILKRVRLRRRRKKSKATEKRDNELGGEELKLQKSLQEGPVHVYEAYDRNRRRSGLRYAQGDEIAHTSLMHTLLKLNTGLVGIISSFLGSGRKDAKLDYRSLTKLSDESRAETIDALGKLYHRISRSDLTLLQPQPFCGRCRRRVHHGPCQSHGDAKSAESNPSRRGDDAAEKRMRQTSRQKDDQASVQRVQHGSAESRLVMVRPRGRRTRSSSTSSSGMKSGETTAVASPTSLPTMTPTTPSPKPVRGHRPPPVHAHSYPTAFPAASPGRTTQHGRVAPVPTRRQDKLTPSYYSFASNSTKLGEIPMRNWTVPFDEAEARRLNEAAMDMPYPWHSPPVEQKERPKGRFRFWKKGED
ncbi:hypothetical protein P152DRAFT_89667 [Eremomyces bilateralis CBS 781.70]|uniref:Uncharacterized protein n=1 Tax=Eremomyces bilateralis CBS 781.70 TaxID=1392243 RepID=A0A6G1FXY9_9PEZI|nr:uncharacterized protein P152DRAFT_89667 [Eremomyces bilateralis CBS 781.70]KAF1810582.1 hypothetical protein P152DRAFT_89667 [Eremomyces bilateralis CBS 781.70]